MAGKESKKNKKLEKKQKKIKAKEEKKRKSIIKTPIESTQSDIPIKDIYANSSGAMIITKDNRYVKILEIRPSTFMLKDEEAQLRTIYTFQSLLKIAPSNLQLCSVTLPANIEHQIKNLTKNIELEDNDQCLQIDAEYADRLDQSARISVSRRFFLSFSYEKTISFIYQPSMDDILNDLNSTAANLASALSACGNEVIEFDDNNRMGQTAEILYTIINRSRSYKMSFQDYLKDVLDKYFEYYGNGDFYVSPTEYLAPKTMAFNDNKFIKIDDLYYSFLYVPSNGYKEDVYAGWLVNYINSYPGVDVNVYLQKKDRGSVTASIRRNLNYNQATLMDTSSTSAGYDQSNDAAVAGYYLKDGLANGQDFYYMAILLTVTGSSPREVDYKIDGLKKIAAQSDMKLKDCTFDEEQAFMSSIPLGKLDNSIWNKAKRNVLTAGASSAYPYMAGEIMDDDGIYLGDDMTSNSLAVVDIFNTKRYSNPNILICGTSGAGKTYSLLLMAIRMRINRIPVFIISPEKEQEMRRVAEGLGGQFVQIGPGSKDRINVMDIHIQDESVSKVINGDIDRISYLSEKTSFLKIFFSLVIDNMDREDEQLLDEAIVTTYNKKGITTDNNSLYDTSDPNHKKLKEMPIISDLRNTLLEMSEKEPKCKRMARILRLFTNSSAKNFDGQTNVNLDTMFTVFGTENMKGDLLPLAVQLCMDYCWSKIRESSLQKDMLFIDEFWRLAFNEEAAAYVQTIAKTCRSYSSALVLSTQQFSDFMANEEFGKGIVGNCQIKFLMKMNSEDIETLKSLIKINESDASLISRFNTGDALMIAGEDRELIHFRASETEHKLIATDRNTLSEIYKEKTSEANVRKVEQNNKASEFDIIDEEESVEPVEENKFDNEADDSEDNDVIIVNDSHKDNKNDHNNDNDDFVIID